MEIWKDGMVMESAMGGKGLGWVAWMGFPGHRKWYA